MALPTIRPRARPRVRVASAAQVSANGDAPKSQYTKRLLEDGQERALTYYTRIGEVRYAAHFYSRMMKRLRLYPAFRSGGDRPEEIEEGLPVELLDRIQDPGGGRTTLLGEYGRLAFITGESYLFGRKLNTDDETWSFVWKAELEFDKRQGELYIIHKPNGNTDEGTVYGPDEAVAYRFWTPHPRLSGKADSPMMGVLDICEELLILTDSVRSTAISRIARGGILFMPYELSFGSAEEEGEEDPDEDPFEKEFTEHMELAIQHPGSAAAASPYVLWGQGEYGQYMRMVQTHDPQRDYLERDLRTEAIKRMALGFDMPPEELLGMAQANHWTAWQIKDETWISHGAPVADQMVVDLNQAYLRPALRDGGFERWQDVVIAYDAAEVTVNPDRSDDANEAWDRGAIGYEEFRRMKNIPESAGQSEVEHLEWLAIKLRDPNLLRGESESEPVGPGEPAEGPDSVIEREGRAASAATAERAAGEMALLRCRGVAGARIRRYQSHCPGCLEAADGQPNSLVASLVGVDGLQRLKVPPPTQLVKGGADDFERLLVTWGYTEAQAGALSETIEVYAARTLLDPHPPPLPASFSAQVRLVKGDFNAVDQA